MPLKELQVSGYRSLRNVRLPLQQLNVVTGPNGSGKSNLYKVSWLLVLDDWGIELPRERIW